jgi:hypothetical protein
VYQLLLECLRVQAHATFKWSTVILYFFIKLGGDRILVWLCQTLFLLKMKARCACGEEHVVYRENQIQVQPILFCSSYPYLKFNVNRLVMVIGPGARKCFFLPEKAFVLYKINRQKTKIAFDSSLLTIYCWRFSRSLALTKQTAYRNTCADQCSIINHIASRAIRH